MMKTTISACLTLFCFAVFFSFMELTPIPYSVSKFTWLSFTENGQPAPVRKTHYIQYTFSVDRILVTPERLDGLDQPDSEGCALLSNIRDH